MTTWDELPIGTVFKNIKGYQKYIKVEKHKVLSSMTNTIITCSIYEISTLMDSKRFERILPTVSPRKPIKWI